LNPHISPFRRENRGSVGSFCNFTNVWIGIRFGPRRTNLMRGVARHSIRMSTTNDRVATRVDENWEWPPAVLDNSGICQVTLSNFQRSVNHCRRHLTMRTTCFGTAPRILFTRQRPALRHTSTASLPSGNELDKMPQITDKTKKRAAIFRWPPAS
jgi:hypothetical protein